MRISSRVTLLVLPLIVGLMASIPAVSVAAAKGQSPVQTVAHVDLKRYMGKWYEIAAIPMFFERKCVGNVSAEYTMLPNGEVAVDNSCETQAGSRIKSIGRARVVDPKTNARLKVTFLNLWGWRFWAGGDYWVIDLDPDYNYAIVGHPTRHYAWILARTPDLSQATLTHLAERLRAQGYDPCQLMTTPQRNGLSQRVPLCQLTH